MRSVGNSRLIEFPKQPNREAGRDTPKPAVPAWRAEVSERVRASRARRSSESEGAASEAPAANAPAANAPEVSNKETSVTTGVSIPRSDNPLVEAALNRVRRAAGTGFSPSGAAGSRNSRSFAAPSVSADRDATAKALQPEPEYVIERAARPLPGRAKPVIKSSVALADAAVYDAPPRKRSIPKPDRAEEPTNTRALEESSMGVLSGTQTVGEFSLAEPIDEIEPRDYLADEIRRVDRALNQEKHRSDGASVLAQLTTNVLDLLVIAISSMPFLVLISLNHAAYFERNTRIAGIAIVLVLSFFYLALTHCLGGRTFGMMLTGTRVVAAGSSLAPSLSRSLRRTVGYYFAMAPAGLGFLWAAVSGSRRGLHDIIGGTAVIRDR